jgi:hypothetical protein
MDIFEEIKEHPYLIGGVALVGVVGFFIITRSGQSSQAVQSGVDPNLASLYQGELQQQAQQQQLSAQLDAAQITANTTSQANQLTAGVDLAQIKAGSTSTDLQTVTAGQVAEDQIAGQLGVANDQLQASTTASTNALLGLENSNASQVNVAGIQASENEQIAALTNQTAQVEIGTLGSVALANSNNNRDVAITAIKGQSGGGGGVWGAIGGIVGGAAAAFGV